MKKIFGFFFLFLIYFEFIRCKKSKTFVSSFYKKYFNYETFYYVFPIYDFNLHNTPVIFTNDTEIESEIKYYNKMRKTTIVHTYGSTILSFLGLTKFLSFGASVGILSSVVLYTTPISLAYWGYNVYITHKSAHLEQKCKFLLNENKIDDRYQKTWEEYLRIPKILFNPILFAILIYLFLFVYVLYGNYIEFAISTTNIKVPRVSFLIVLILFFYVYSFFQTIRSSNLKLDVKRGLIRKEIKWKCHVNRMTFTRKLKKTVFSLVGIQSDEDGYLVGDKECMNLELSLYNIEESIIDIMYKTITRSLLSIVKELFNSIRFIDKILIIFISIIFIILRPYFFFIFLKKKGLGEKKEKKKWK